MDELFKALADPSRRALLDALRSQNGQTTSQLEQVLEMTRFGTMKHLAILEAANLIVTKKVGRFKYHYLNTVPIQELSDRWISRYAQPWTMQLVDIKNLVQGRPLMQATAVKPKHVFQVYIKTTPEKLWDAITNPKLTEQYYFGTRIITDLKPGTQLFYDMPDGQHLIEGKLIEAIPNKRLVHTFAATWKEANRNDAPTRVTYEIEPMGEMCKLTLTHDDFDGETNTYQGVGNGWPLILSSLKTLLETGSALPAKM